jgi:hypothetical protein
LAHSYGDLVAAYTVASGHDNQDIMKNVMLNPSTKPFELQVPNANDHSGGGSSQWSWANMQFYHTYYCPMINYIMIMGHDFGALDGTQQTCEFGLKTINPEASDQMDVSSTDSTLKRKNASEGSTSVSFKSDNVGYSLVLKPENDPSSADNQSQFFPWNGNTHNFLQVRLNNMTGTKSSVNISTISTGYTYVMPFSPDLNLSMSYDFDGIKQTKTRGGATLSNATYTSPPQWSVSGSPWDLHPSNKITRGEHSGRRVWDLSFSYMSDEDLFPSNMLDGSNNPYWASGTSWDGVRNDFYSTVIMGTRGGHLPFIFQPDKDDFTNFALARFDQNSFKITQKAHGVYNIKLKIRESW